MNKILRLSNYSKNTYKKSLTETLPYDEPIIKNDINQEELKT